MALYEGTERKPQKLDPHHMASYKGVPFPSTDRGPKRHQNHS